MDIQKLRKLNNLHWDKSKYSHKVSDALNEQFNKAVEDGAIHANIQKNSIQVSKKWLSNEGELTNMGTINFWEKVAEISDGKKISLDFETHLNKHFISLEKFVNKEIVNIEDEDIFLALLDLEKTNKYFSKKSVECLNLYFDSSTWNDRMWFDKELKINIETQIANKVEMPAGFNNWVVKTTPVSLGLNTPENKMAMMVWKKTMADLKITKKVFNKVIETLSKDTTINNQQWDIILEKVGTPKWLLTVMDSFWSSKVSYGKGRIREMDSNGEFDKPKANLIIAA